MEAPPPVEVSILVVSYNTRDLTLACLRSIREQTQERSYEVRVMDNASEDGSYGALKSEFGEDERFHILSAVDNLGFARATNRLAQDARGDYLLLLNPDTLVLDGALDKLTQFARTHAKHGIWAGRTVFADGTLNRGGCFGSYTLRALASQALGLSRLFPRSRLLNPRAYPGWDRTGVREVGMIAGCFCLITRDLWHELGGFDERFVMYAEDADLCLRARRLGARPIVTGAAEIVHYGAASEPTREARLVKLLGSELRFFQKHWGRPRFFLAKKCVETRVLLRALVERCLPGAKRVRPWSAVWRRRREWWVRTSHGVARAAESADNQPPEPVRSD